MGLLEAITGRIQTTPSNAIVVTEYCARRAGQRGVDIEQAKRNVVDRQDGRWTYSKHGGIEGKRITVDFRVSRKKTHRYVLECNDRIYLINVIVIEGKKTKGFDQR